MLVKLTTVVYHERLILSVSQIPTHKYVIVNQGGQGGYSQNFLRKILKIFVTLT
jgi:hypothetical protein